MCRESLDVPFPVEDKEALYRRAGGKCQHPGGCTEREFYKLTIDHFTPVCLGRMLGWKQEQIDSFDNLQLLCKYHHTLKDALTPLKKLQIIQQRQGKFIPLGGHI